MQLTFKVSQELDTGKFPAVLHYVDNVVKLFYIADERFILREAIPDPDSWDNLEFSFEKTICMDDAVDNFKVRGLPHEKMWFTWQAGSVQMICPWPDDSPPYPIEDPYRFFYAVDTDKLYMNIYQRWQFIATSRHELLRNIGTLSHDELEAKIRSLENRVNALEES